MNHYLPNGTLGIALAGLLAAFMAGMAANVSSFNTVFTYDIWQTYVRKNLPDHYYLNVGRVVTVVGIVIGIGTAFIAAGYNNIHGLHPDAVRLLQRAALRDLHHRACSGSGPAAWAGFSGPGGRFFAAPAAFQYLIGPNSVLLVRRPGRRRPAERADDQLLRRHHGLRRGRGRHRRRVTLVTKPKPVQRAGRAGLGQSRTRTAGDPHEGYVRRWWESPKLLGFTALGIVLVLSIIFI